MFVNGYNEPGSYEPRVNYYGIDMDQIKLLKVRFNYMDAIMIYS